MVTLTGNGARRGRSYAGWLVALCALVLGAVALVATPAGAEEPARLDEQVHDTAGVLAGSESEVDEALAELDDEAGLQLWVAYVDSFDGLDGATWAEQTFEASQLGGNDVLLAVAVEDRAYSTWTTEQSGLTPAGMSVVEQDFIEPALGDDDWAGAVVAGAEGLAQVLDDPPESGSSGGSSSGGGVDVPWFFLVPVGAIAASMFISARGRRAAKRRPAPAGGMPTEDANTQGVPTQELERQAAEELVALDNAVRSADEELAFAEAQFGQQRTQQFREVLEHARQQARQAFSLRQQLDDDQEEPEPVARTMLGQIIALCGSARTALDARAKEFADLRSLEDRAPEFLEELAGRAGEVRGRLPVADQQIKGLSARYPALALGTVTKQRDQAAQLLESSDGFIASGRESVGSGNRPSAVAAARAAEEAIGQAVRLLDAIDRAGEDLANSQEALSTAIASISSDIRDAARLAPRDQTVQGAVARAREVIEQAQDAHTSGDPLAALAALDAAEYQLDTLLEPMRDAESHRTKVRVDFTERAQRVGARLRSIDETISTTRGAVNSSARTRISEALRLFDQAQAAAQDDPTQASSLLNRAEQLGEQALSEAQQDLDRFDDWGGSGPRRRSGGLDPLSLILGGILSGGGHHHGGWGGGGGRGWGGGSSWGGGGGGFGGGGGGFGGGGGGFGGGGGRF